MKKLKGLTATAGDDTVASIPQDGLEEVVAKNMDDLMLVGNQLPVV